MLRHLFQVPGIAIGALHHRQSPRESDHEVRGNSGIATELSPRGRRRERVPNESGEIVDQPLDPGLDRLAGERQLDRRLGRQAAARRGAFGHMGDDPAEQGRQRDRGIGVRQRLPDKIEKAFCVALVGQQEQPLLVAIGVIEAAALTPVASATSIIDVAANPFCQKVARAASSSASSSNCRVPTMG